MAAIEFEKTELYMPGELTPHSGVRVFVPQPPRTEPHLPVADPFEELEAFEESVTRVMPPRSGRATRPTLQSARPEREVTLCSAGVVHAADVNELDVAEVECAEEAPSSSERSRGSSIAIFSWAEVVSEGVLSWVSCFGTRRAR